MTGLISEPRRLHSQEPTTVSAAIHTIRMRQIWARIQVLVYPQTGHGAHSEMSILVESFKTELRDWLDKAPKQLPSNRAANNAFGSDEWFRIMYHHSILLLHRHRLVSNSQAVSLNPAETCSVYMECAESAEVICSIYRKLFMSQQLNDTWGALHVLFLGGMTFIHCLWADPETRRFFRADKVAATCTSCMVILAVMAERWEAVKPYRDAFDMLSSATQTMLAESSSLSGPLLSTSVQDQLNCHLSSMTEIGMCQSVEEILSSMIS